MNIYDALYIIRSDRPRLLAVLVIALSVGTIVFIGDDREAATEPPSASSASDAQPQSRHEQHYAVEQQRVHLQPFDPNTADSTLLLSLGLQPWQVRSIYRYRAKGGVYTRPEDFARLYGLSVKKYRELRPYIRISPDYRPASELYAHEPNPTRGQYDGTSGSQRQTERHGGGSTQAAMQSASNLYPQKIEHGETVNANAADTTELCRIPGIGPYFARRIVRYRERLGGFASKSQLLEIQDFPESALPFIDIDATSGGAIRKLNLNTATNEQLRSHPYITYTMARQICDFRRLKGRITDISHLRLLPTFTPEVIRRLTPYIEY